MSQYLQLFQSEANFPSSQGGLDLADLVFFRQPPTLAYYDSSFLDRWSLRIDRESSLALLPPVPAFQKEDRGLGLPEMEAG